MRNAVSWQATKWAHREAPVDGLTPADRLVLYDLAERASDHDDGKGQSAWPSVATIAEATGLTRRGVQKGLRSLERVGLVIATKRPLESSSYTLPITLRRGEHSSPPGVNTVRGEGANTATPRGEQSSPGGRTERHLGSEHSSPKPIKKPEGNPEENTQDARASSEDGLIHEQVVELCSLLADEIAHNGITRPDPDQPSWREAARGMIIEDGYDSDEIADLIRWAQADEFWAATTDTMAGVRKHWNKLKLNTLRENGTEQRVADRIAERELAVSGGAS